MSPKILIVDDTPVNVELLDYILRAEGFRTCSASDGHMALEVGREERPDLVLLDVMMPGENGFETCARLKSDPLTADIPVIFVSAMNDVKSKVTGLRSGGVDYISKPVDGEEVLARIRVHLRIQENNRAMTREHQARIEEFEVPNRLFSSIRKIVPRLPSPFITNLSKKPVATFMMFSPSIPASLVILWLTSAVMASARHFSRQQSRLCCASIRTAVLPRGHDARNRCGNAPDAG